MRVLLIDNEPGIRSSIKELLKAFCTEAETIEEATGVEDGLQKIKSFRPDLLLLDVEMEDGTGFDLMKQIKDPGFQLIFITAHNQYAIEAFGFSAIDYLLKPVDPYALQKSVQKAFTNIRNNNLQQQVEILLQQLTGRQNHDRKIVLRDIDNTYFIRIADIIYCHAEGTYTKFYLQYGNPILVSKNLKEYEKLLEPLGFIRTHHSYLANRDKINRYDKTDGGSLLLEGDHAIPLSQRKREWVLEMLEGK